MKECGLCTNPEPEQWIDNREKIYHYCSKCGIIQLDQTHFLSTAEEQNRYLRHNNAPENKGYITYLTNFIDTAVIPYVKPGGEILDFGSGPLPVLSDLLTSRGFPTQSYDPFFNDITDWKTRSFDAIVAVEVFEHLHHPEKVIPLIHKALKPEGYLILRTLLHEENYKSFMKWWYREDKTHVTFYSEKTMEYICSRWYFELQGIKDNCEITLRKK
jgi:SAM-dependent methyltransferase